MRAAAEEPLTVERLQALHAEFARLRAERRTTVHVVNARGWWLENVELIRVPRARHNEYWMPRKAWDRLVAETVETAQRTGTLGVVEKITVVDRSYAYAQIMGLPVTFEEVLPPSFDGSPTSLYRWLPYPLGMEP